MAGLPRKENNTQEKQYYIMQCALEICTGDSVCKHDGTRFKLRSISSSPSTSPLTVITCSKMPDAIIAVTRATLICSPQTCLGSSARFMSLIKHFHCCHHHLASQI